MSPKISETIDLDTLAVGYNKKRRLPVVILTEILEAMESFLWIKMANKVADLGAGTGRFLIPLAERNPDVKFVGVDTAQGMLEGCRHEIKQKQLTNVDLVEADLEKGVPTLDQSIDSAIVYHVFHLLKNKTLLIGELKRILRRGGRVLIASTSHRQLENTWNYRYMPKILEWELRRTPDMVEIVKMFKQNGFKLIGVKEINIKKSFGSIDEWINFFRLRPISILSGLKDDELELILKEASDRLKLELGDNISFEYGFDYHTQLYFEKL